MNLTDAEFDFLDYIDGNRREFKCDEMTRNSLKQYLGGLGLISGEPLTVTPRGREVLFNRKEDIETDPRDATISRLRAALDVAEGAINATLDYIGLPDEDWPRERHTIWIKNRMSVEEIKKAKGTSQP